jgi:hypothetical protein
VFALIAAHALDHPTHCHGAQNACDIQREQHQTLQVEDTHHMMHGMNAPISNA